MWVKVHIKLMVIYYAWSQGDGWVHKAPLILYNWYLLAQVLMSGQTNDMYGHLEKARTVCPCIVILLLKALPCREAHCLTRWSISSQKFLYSLSTEVKCDMSDCATTCVQRLKVSSITPWECYNYLTICNMSTDGAFDMPKQSATMDDKAKLLYTNAMQWTGRMQIVYWCFSLWSSSLGNKWPHFCEA